jgi:hypothetical protein
MYLTKYQGLGTKGTPININWSQFATSNLQIVSEKTRATSTGFYQLTPGAAATQIFSKSTTTPAYSPNSYTINAALNSASTVITFTIVFADLATTSGRPPTWAIDEPIKGTITSYVDGFYANNASTVTVTRPSGSSTGP